MLCVDEKSQIQALDRTAPILPIRPGIPEKQTHDYVRRCEPFVWTKPADDIVKKATKVTRLQWRDTSRAGRW